MAVDPRADISVPSPTDPREALRMAAIDELEILDTRPEDRFDVIVRLARQMYGAEAAAFTVLDRDRVWHKSKAGTDVEGAPRTTSFCSIAIKGEGTMIIPDTAADERFDDNPAVPGVRFYAGAPVYAPNGQPVGTLCVWDSHARTAGEFDDTQIKQLAHAIELELRVKPFGKNER
jgi:GAF domain-containing protein